MIRLCVAASLWAIGALQPASAQVYGGAGLGWIHEQVEPGVAWTVGFTVPSETRARALDARVSGGTPDEGYLAGLVGIQFGRTTASLGPTLGLHAGGLIEPEFFGWVAQGSLGVRIRIGTIAVRVEGAAGIHGLSPGPFAVWIGIEL